MADGPGAHAHARGRAVGHVDDVGAGFLQSARGVEQVLRRVAARWRHLDADDEFAAGQLVGESGGAVRRDRFLFIVEHDYGQMRCRAGRIVQRLAHGDDVLGPGAAAAADEDGAQRTEGERVFGKVVHRCRVHHAAAHCLREAGVGLRGVGQAGRAVAHGLQQARDLGRAAAAVDADDVRAGFRQSTRDGARQPAQLRAVIGLEGHLADCGQRAVQFTQGCQRLQQFTQVAEGFQHD